MKTKPVTATAGNVSRKLTAAGCQKREAYRSTVKGWKNYTSGFVCEQRADYVRVEYHSSIPERTVDAQVQAARLRPYREALEPSFAVEVHEDHLRIRAKPIDQVAPKNEAAVALARARWDHRTPPTEAPTTIGGRLRAARLEKGLTLAALGQRTGLKVPALSSYEQDVNRCPPAKLAILAEALGKTVAQLTQGA